MGDEWRGRFVGVGEGAYQHHEPLERAVGDIEQLRALLQGIFDGEPACDFSESQVTEYLKSLLYCMQGGPWVLLWSGHGLRSAGGLRLLATDSGCDPMAGLSVGEVVGVNRPGFRRDSDP